MLKKIIPEDYRKLYALFNRGERFKILILFLMMLFAAFLEVAGIGMIPVFIAIVADPSLVMGYEPIGNVLETLGIVTSQDLLVAGAILLVGIFVFKGAYMLFFFYIKTRFIYNRRYYFSSQMMSSYMRAPYTFHLGRNTSELLRNTTSEVNLVINQVLTPTLELAKELIMVTTVVIFLLLVEPLITLVVFVVLGGATGIFLFVTRKKVKEYGIRELAYRSAMIKAVNEGLGGLKEARVLNREEDFIQTFRETAFWSSRLQATTAFIRHIPKPVIEAIAVAGMMVVAIIMVWQGRPITAIIPVLALFGVATVRLMPAVQRITSTITTLTYGMASVTPVHDDLKLMRKSSREFVEDRKKNEQLRLSHQIEFSDVSYSYPESSEQSLKNISITIPRGKAVAFVGPSGAGKTTIVDILLGLLEPDQGKILVDGKDISESISAWQKNIGYIPQFIYLSDSSLRRNIAFGLRENEIDDEKILKAVELAQLSELVRSMPDGLDTIIGEAGTRLSGGQRQRVGIARALYHEPEVLVMDEATSALDNITEKQITEAIESLKGERTIIMIAHRLTTVENCDVLFMMKNGKITDMGKYDELVKNNHEFRRMALVE